MKNARLAAFELVYNVINNSSYSNLSLDSALKDVSSEDKSFFSALSLGVIERRITLDYIVSRFLTSRTKPKVKILLYLGAYQLYFMDKIPSSAAVNETVELSKQVGCSYYSGLINALLHKIDENRIDVDSLEDLSVRYSCPSELINMWKKHYGDENTLNILNEINGVPPVFAIPNTLYVDRDELGYEFLCDKIENEPYGDVIKITSPFDLSKSNAFKNGLFHIEDYSSYLCAKALEAKEGETVFDVCSAPGGKAFTIAEAMNNRGNLYAFDLHINRVKLISDGAERLGLTCIKADVNDASVYNPSLPKADKILCDVPCSGFGIIRRKPEIRYKELDGIKELFELQYQILLTSSKYLKRGGRIVYSTCTLNKKENEKVVKRFLDENGGFKLLSQKTIFPEADSGDGFFFSVMELNDD